MWTVILSVWFKCFIISWTVSAFWFGMSAEKTWYGGPIKTILYYILLTALLGLGLSLLVLGGLLIVAFTCSFFNFIF